MYVDEKRTMAVFFFFQIENDAEGTTVLLQGLDPDATYSVREINVDQARDGIVKSATGKQLMEKGMFVPLKNKNESVVLELERR